MFKFGIIAASAGSGGYTPANIADVAFWLNPNVSTPTNVPRTGGGNTPPNSIFKVQSIPNSYVVGESATWWPLTPCYHLTLAQQHFPPRNMESQ